MSNNYSKELTIALWALFLVILTFLFVSFVFYPAELKCATSFFVAPDNVGKACAQFIQE